VIFRQDYPHHEMPLVYRAASVCVSVPETDGAPASVTEAMVIGVPLCVSRLPWAEEPPYSESRMRLVPVGDHLQLADEICALLGSDNAADVEANRDLAWRVAGWERCYGRFEPEYERLIAAAA
jgi:Glycosyl transferases group 1